MKPVVAYMAGTVWKILVKKGSTVQAGQDVVVLESMKMEVPIQAEVAGVVQTVRVREGDFVNLGDVLIELD